jgi:hypothetical protein
MTGALTLPGNATLALQAVPLQQLNAATAGGPFLPLAGGTVGALTVTGAATISSGTATLGGNIAANMLLYMQSAAGFNRFIGFLSGAGGASGRWYIGANGAAEGGGNVGSDFVFQRYDNTGALLDQPLQITRSTGAVALHSSLGVWNATPPASKPTVTGAKGSNAALASLLAALAAYGLITDSSTA